MSAREPLNMKENIAAVFAGLGIFLLMAGGAMLGFGSDSDTAQMVVLAGAILLAIGTGMWLATQPWKRFDDLKTPYYTGHHHDEHEEEYADVVTLEDDAAAIVADAMATAEIAEVDVVEEAAEAVEAAEDATLVEEAVEVVEDVAPVEEAVEAVEAVEDAAPVEEAVEAVAEEAETVAEAVAEEAETVAEVVEDATPAEPDDLKIIEGIGPKVAAALNTSGITTFAQIADMSPTDLERIVKTEQKVRIVGSTTTWVRQAKLAAEGNMSALNELQERVKSGYLYDELTQIGGISKAVQDTLYAARVRSFDDLARADVSGLQKALKKAGLEDLDPTDWPQQARTMAEKLYG